MDREETVLVRGCANHVGDAPEGPGEERRVAEENGRDDLERDDAEDDVLGQGLVAAELGDLGEALSQTVPREKKNSSAGCPYLWVSLDDGNSARAMRLLGIGPEEVIGSLEGLLLLLHLRILLRTSASALRRLGDGRGGGRHIVSVILGRVVERVGQSIGATVGEKGIKEPRE